MIVLENVQSFKVGFDLRLVMENQSDHLSHSKRGRGCV